MENQLNLFENITKNLPKQKKQPISHEVQRKLLKPIRNQSFFLNQTLDEQLPFNHEARAVWAFVESLDLSLFEERIMSLEGEKGRSSIDSKILIALWIYGLSDGVIAAKKIAQYCIENIAYSWICGSVSVQRHVLSNFRSKNADLFEQMVIQSVALLVDKDLITLNEISQDGVKIKASAAKESMRRKKTLLEKAMELNKHIKKLEKEEKTHAIKKGETEKRQREIRENKNKLKRVIKAAKEINHHKELLNRNRLNNRKKKLSNKEISKIRGSTTDPECRKMKMADKSVQCAYNFQIAIETSSELVLKTNTIQSSADTGTMLPMFEDLKKIYSSETKRYLVDPAYIKKDDLVAMHQQGCAVYSPINKGAALGMKKKVLSRKKKTLLSKKKVLSSKEKVSDAEKEFIYRMQTEEAQEIYNKRLRSSETINAFIKNRRLSQLTVRGLKKVKGFIDLICLTYNMRIIKRAYPSLLV